MNLHARVEHIEERINAACQRSGRTRQEIQVIAVTKYVSLETTREVLREGLVHLGENRWQDAESKWQALGNKGIWHFLGTLQTNKVKEVIGKFRYIHSLDRLSLALELEKRAAMASEQVHCFIQLNISGESSKNGLEPNELLSFARKVQEFKSLRIIGLMTMAPHESNPERTRPIFRSLRQLRDQLNESRILDEPVPHLSMGMSNDYEVAIEEGATWIRLGSVLAGNDNI